jgi:transposase-like protein
VSRKKKYSEEFRAETLKKMEQCSNVSALARELGVRRKWLYQWRDEARAAARDAVSEVTVEDSEKAKLRGRVAELEQLVGRQTAELDCFKGALRRVEARRQQNGATGGAASTSKSR